MKTFNFQLVPNYSLEGLFPRFGTGTFKILLQDGDYYGELVVKAGGNVHGSELIEVIAESFDDMDLQIDMKLEENKKHALIDEDGYLKGVLLYNKNGDSLEIVDDGGDLKHVVVGIVMINYETKNVTSPISS